MKRILVALLLTFGASGVTHSQTAGGGKSPKQNQQQQQPQLRTADGVSDESSGALTQGLLAKAVRHELLTLPFYNVFDWIDFQLSADGTAITLRGQVVRPTTKSGAEQAVKKIEGVAQIDNQIEVLPLSPMDDDLRRRVYRAVYNFDSPLFRYGVQAVPPIHIIVDRGRVTLKGVVASKSDSSLANIAARGVSGVFGVTNDLQVESDATAAGR